jgi:hypothetical protein
LNGIIALGSRENGTSVNSLAEVGGWQSLDNTPVSASFSFA